VARFGGDEFILLLSETTAQQGLTVAERLRARVAETRIPDAKEAPGITLSIGIAELRRNPIDEGVEQIVQRADEALYRAKAGGRNRAVIFESGMV
jgi:diguanylate cyclase (GGDEF)-like protein